MNKLSSLLGGVFVLALTMSHGIHQEIWGQQLEWTFVDEARSSRDIPVFFKFDPDQTGPFPLVVLGHGFLMGPEDYDDMSGYLTEAGFAVALLGTETGLTPSHGDFGLDMAFVANHASAEVGGALEGLISNATALVGHSMGGGASWLGAAEMGASLGAVIGWAPAETSPSAIAAAGNVTAPALVISGTGDAITPPLSSHIPVYESLPGTTCRGFASLENGSHCGYSDSGTLCDFGELGFSGMSREAQQAHTAALTVGWVQHHLTGDPSAWIALQSYGEEEDDVTLTLDCTPSLIATASHAPTASCHPNPVQSTLHLELPWLPESACIRSASGRTFATWSPTDGPTIDVSTWPAGLYFLHLVSLQRQQVLRFVKVH